MSQGSEPFCDDIPCVQGTSPRLIWILALSCHLSGLGDGATLSRAGSSGPFFSTFLLVSLFFFF